MQLHFSPLPLNEVTLCRFVASLHADSLSYQTIRCYLSALRHLQIMQGLPDPSITSFPRLEYVLKGLRREGPLRSRGQRLPITPEILRKIYGRWSQEPRTFDTTMLWAAYCLGFFAFMRSGEFTCPSLQAFMPHTLSPTDIRVDSHTAPTHMTVFLRQSTTDQFGAGLLLHLGTTGDSLCPVISMLSYLAIRPPSPGPLFLFSDGSTLSRSRLVQSLRQVLPVVGVEATHYNGHSFRIGAAMTAARAGLSDSLIQTLGRWKSSSFMTYIQTPRRHLATVSATLASQLE